MVKVRISAESIEDARLAVARLVHGWKHHRIKKVEPASVDMDQDRRFVFWVKLWD